MCEFIDDVHIISLVMVLCDEVIPYSDCGIHRKDWDCGDTCLATLSQIAQMVIDEIW